MLNNELVYSLLSLQKSSNSKPLDFAGIIENLGLDAIYSDEVDSVKLNYENKAILIPRGKKGNLKSVFFQLGAILVGYYSYSLSNKTDKYSDYVCKNERKITELALELLLPTQIFRRYMRKAITLDEIAIKHNVDIKIVELKELDYVNRYF